MHYSRTIIFFLICTCLLPKAAYPQEKPGMPTTADELRLFFQKITAKEIDVKKISGTYALPKELTAIGSTKVKYIEFTDGRITLKKEFNDTDGYMFAYQPSLDKLISATTAGDLLGLIKLTDGGDYWTVTSERHMLAPDGKFPFPGIFRIMPRFCFFSNASMVFCNIQFLTKVSEETNRKRPLDAWGPLFWQMESSQITLDEKSASFKEK